jgi:IS5 family transposase
MIDLSTYSPYLYDKFGNINDSPIEEGNMYWIIANAIDWTFIEHNLIKYYDLDIGAPARPIRLMVGLQLLKYMDNLSDEKVIARWTSDSAYKYFTGSNQFDRKPPCDSSLMTKFRQRIGEEGFDIIFQASVNAFGPKKLNQLKLKVNIDTTVQEKYTAFPTDHKLALDVIFALWEMGTVNDIKFRCKHKGIVKSLRREAAFIKSNTKKVDREKILVELRKIGLALLEEFSTKVQPKLADKEKFNELHSIFYRALTQQKDDKNKIYSIHEPQIYCICKGKTHKPYEFGTKVALLQDSKNKIIYAAKSLSENIHDSKTVDILKEQIKSNFGIISPQITGDRAYSSVKEVLTPRNLKKTNSPAERAAIQKELDRRSVIEQEFSHMKNDFRLSRNMLKGKLGDKINPLLSATAANLTLIARNELNIIKKKNQKPMYPNCCIGAKVKSPERRRSKRYLVTKLKKKEGLILFTQRE